MTNSSTAIKVVDSLKGKEIFFIEDFLGAISRARDAEQWLQDDVFVEILSVGMRLAALTAADLSRDESISRSAVSKWISRNAVPPVPTRKTVILWIEENLRERVKKLKGQMVQVPAQNEPHEGLEEVG